MVAYAWNFGAGPFLAAPEAVLAAGDLPDDLPSDVPGDLPDDVPGGLPDDLLSDIPGDLPDDIPGDLPGDLPVDLCGDLSVVFLLTGFRLAVTDFGLGLLASFRPFLWEAAGESELDELLERAAFLPLPTLATFIGESDSSLSCLRFFAVLLTTLGAMKSSFPSARPPDCVIAFVKSSFICL